MKHRDCTARALSFRDKVLPLMAELRLAVNHAETKTGAEYWPYPTYEDLLFGVR